MARPKKIESKETSGYTIEKSATAGFLVRFWGVPVYVAVTQKDADRYVSVVSGK